MNSVDTDSIDPMKAVYELREAAVEHGKAIANLEVAPSPVARDEVLATQTLLEQKTVAALDECSENAEEAVSTALENIA